MDIQIKDDSREIKAIEEKIERTQKNLELYKYKSQIDSLKKDLIYYKNLLELMKDFESKK